VAKDWPDGDHNSGPGPRRGRGGGGGAIDGEYSTSPRGFRTGWMCPVCRDRGTLIDGQCPRLQRKPPPNIADVFCPECGQMFPWDREGSDAFLRSLR